MYIIIYISLILSFCSLPSLSETTTREIAFGAVLSASGSNVRTLELMRRGYQLAVDTINGNGGFAVAPNAPKYKLKLYVLDDAANATLHQQQIAVLANMGVKIILGAGSEMAFAETSATNRLGLLNMQCCVGPDQVYQQGFANVFGVQVSNTKYPQQAVAWFALKNAKTAAIIYNPTNIFTATTCSSALSILQSTNIQVVANVPFNVSDPLTIQRIINDLENIKPDVLFGKTCSSVPLCDSCIPACTLLDDATKTAVALKQHGKRYRGVFMTVGTSDPQWVLSVDADYYLGAAQWDPQMIFDDPFFGNSSAYSALYYNTYNETVGYVSAGASASIVTILQGYIMAYTSLNLLPGAVTVNQLGDGMRLLTKLSTIFGYVEFNKWNRNSVNDPATTQVFPHGKIVLVLPLQFSKVQLVYPIPGTEFVVWCDPGYYSDFDTTSCIACPVGRYKPFSDTTTHVCPQCPSGFYGDAAGLANCIACPPLSTTNMLGATDRSQCTCVYGTYRVDGNCSVCPEGGLCLGQSSSPQPLAGFWSTTRNNFTQIPSYPLDTIIPCPGQKDACPDNSTICSVGYGGVLCYECDRGYFNFAQACLSCSETFSQQYRVVYLLVLLLIITLWVGLNRMAASTLDSIDVSLQYLQIAGIIGQFHVDWTPRLQNAVAALTFVNFDIDIISPQCVWPSYNFSYAMIINLSLPVLIAVFQVFQLLTRIAYRKLRPSRASSRMPLSLTVSEWAQSFVTNFTTFLDITHTSIAMRSLSIFSCQRITEDYWVVETDPTQRCYTKQYYALVVLCGIALAVFVIGVPVLFSCILYFGAKKKKFDDAAFQKLFGWMYIRFEEEFFWWQLVFIGRRLLFIVIVVFIRDGVLQMVLAAAILALSLLLHFSVRPFDEDWMDMLEAIFLILNFCLLGAGLLLTATNQPRSPIEAATIGIFVVAALLMIVAISWDVHIYRQHRTVVELIDDYLRGDEGALSLAETLLPHAAVAVFSRKEITNSRMKDFLHLGELIEAAKYVDPAWHKRQRQSREATKKLYRRIGKSIPEILDFLIFAPASHRVEFCQTLKRLGEFASKQAENEDSKEQEEREAWESMTGKEKLRNLVNNTKHYAMDMISGGIENGEAGALFSPEEIQFVLQALCESADCNDAIDRLKIVLDDIVVAPRREEFSSMLYELAQNKRRARTSCSSCAESCEPDKLVVSMADDDDATVHTVHPFGPPFELLDSKPITEKPKPNRFIIPLEDEIEWGFMEKVMC